MILELKNIHTNNITLIIISFHLESVLFLVFYSINLFTQDAGTKVVRLPRSFKAHSTYEIFPVCLIFHNIHISGGETMAIPQQLK